jgi:diguanylate cyclase (GGDEF)-like protein/PAS domain S-box-containing protein
MVANVTGYAVTILDRETRISWVNDSFTRLTGYGLSEAKGRRPSELLIVEDGGSETLRRMTEDFQRQRGSRYVVHVRSKDGRESWLQSDAQPFFDKHGAIEGWVCIQADATSEVQRREAARFSENRLRMMIEGGNIGTWELDTSTEAFQTNTVFLTTLGYCAEDGQRGFEWLRDELCHPDDVGGLQRSIRDVWEGRAELFRRRYRLRAKDGSWRWVMGAGGILARAKDGSALRLFGVQLDMTEHKLAEEQAQEELRISEAKHRSLYDMSPLGITLSDAGGRLLQINRAMELITGYKQEELLGFSPLDLGLVDREVGGPQGLGSVFQQGHLAPVEVTLLRKDGCRIPVQLTAVLVKQPNGDNQVWSMIEDISVRKRSEQRISFLAYHDALTHLENRLGLRSKLEEKLRLSDSQNPTFAVVLIDLDRFKYVNDTLGHDAGDQLLVEIASRLRSVARAHDVVARLGGDEFVVVLNGDGGEPEIQDLVEKLFGKTRGNIRLSRHTVYMTCSIGISLFPRDGSDVSALLKHADLAMYSVKAQGGDSYRRFDKSMRPSTDTSDTGTAPRSPA